MVLSLFTMFTEQAFAVPTQVVHADNPAACDTLMVPNMVDELVTLQSDFPDELISSEVIVTDIKQEACTPIPSTSITLVEIKNLSPFDYSDLWYVVDDGTVISNFDGGVDFPVNPMFNRAFKIDSVGTHKPLVSEDITENGIFESGEKWEFILNSYSGSGDASAFASVGVPSSDSKSTGSIIALRIENGVTVGGVSIGIDTTAVLLAGAQMTSAWLVPFIVAALGIGIVITRKF